MGGSARIYGELFDAVYLSNKYQAPIASDFWKRLRSYTDWVAQHRSARGQALGSFPQEFTYLALISAAFNLNRTFEGQLLRQAGPTKGNERTGGPCQQSLP